LTKTIDCVSKIEYDSFAKEVESKKDQEKIKKNPIHLATIDYG
jgi:hypothetical protein